MESVMLHLSSCGRVFTGLYHREKDKFFCLAEPTSSGVLVTEFNSEGEVVNQAYGSNVDARGCVEGYVGTGIQYIEVKAEYRGIVMNAKCRNCGGTGLVRELDTHKLSEIRDVPVVPLFLCSSCKSAHYSLTDAYLRKLVESNRDLFEADELAGISADMNGSINTLQEYIIRIFASKKISRATPR
jgi:hypothetical protein